MSGDQTPTYTMRAQASNGGTDTVSHAAEALLRGSNRPVTTENMVRAMEAIARANNLERVRIVQQVNSDTNQQRITIYNGSGQVLMQGRWHAPRGNPDFPPQGSDTMYECEFWEYRHSGRSLRSLQPGEELRKPAGYDGFAPPSAQIPPNCPTCDTPIPPVVEQATPPVITLEFEDRPLPIHATPRDFDLVRAATLSGAIMPERADAAAEGQLGRRQAAGTWAGGGPGLGRFFERFTHPAMAIPIYPLRALSVGLGFASLAGDGTYDRAEDGQPGGWTTGGGDISMLGGFTYNRDGRFERVEPGDGRNQPEYTIMNPATGRVDWRLTLSSRDDDRNHSMFTEARITEALQSPNGFAGWVVVQGAEQQIQEAYTRFHATPNQADAQLVLNLLGTASRTDYAQLTGLDSYYAQVQTMVVAEAAAAVPTITGLTEYNMTRPETIPTHDRMNPPVHPVRAMTYAQMSQTPGFEDYDLTEAQYNERFAGANLDFVVRQSYTGTNRVRQDLRMTRGEVLSGEGILRNTEAALAVVDTNAASRTAFLQEINRDGRFGAPLTEHFADVMRYPAHYGFRDAAAARAYAVSRLGESVVAGQFDISGRDIPDPDSPGVGRDPEAVAAAYAANTTEAELSEDIRSGRWTRMPNDPDSPENLQGQAGQGIVYQIAVQPGVDPSNMGNAYNAVVAAAGLDPTQTETFYQHVLNAGHYTGRESDHNIRPIEIARTVSDEVRRTGINYGSVDASNNLLQRDGALAQVTGSTVVATAVDLRGIQTAELTAGQSAAAIEGTRLLLSDRSTAAVMVQSAGLRERQAFVGVVLRSMAENPDAYREVMRQLRGADNEGFFGFLGTSQQERLANYLEQEVRHTQELVARNASPAEFLAQSQRLTGYLGQIDAQAGRSAEDVQVTEPIRWYSTRSGRWMEGEPTTRNFDDRRAYRRAERQAQRSAEREFERAQSGQDSVAQLAQLITNNDGSYTAIHGTLDEITTTAATADDTSLRMINAVAVANGELATGGVQTDRGADKVRTNATTLLAADTTPEVLAAARDAGANVQGVAHDDMELTHTKKAIPWELLAFIPNPTSDTPGEPPLTPKPPPGGCGCPGCAPCLPPL